MRKFTVAILSLLMGLSQLSVVGFGFGGTALAAGCSAAGSTGMTAAVVARTGQFITGDINATGCDLGVYVGPDARGVVIKFAHIWGANYHGVFAQDTRTVAVLSSDVSNNAAGGEAFPETKAIQLTGTSDSVVANNTVMNNGGGGIAVTDDGDLNPGGPKPGMLMSGNGNLISGNTVTDNTGGCGIVVSAYNPGGGVNDNTVDGNTVINNPAGIVVAADTPDTSADGNVVTNNTSNGNGLAGIIVHSNAPGDSVTNTTVDSNSVDSNGLPEPGLGIVVAAEAPTAILDKTTVENNTISHENIGIAQKGDTNSTIDNNTFNEVGSETGTEPAEPPH